MLLPSFCTVQAGLEKSAQSSAVFRKTGMLLRVNLLMSDVLIPAVGKEAMIYLSECLH